jgi:hypothetical protein
MESILGKVGCVEPRLQACILPHVRVPLEDHDLLAAFKMDDDGWVEFKVTRLA